MADKPMEILDVHIPCQTCGKLIPAGGNSNCLTCRVWQLRLKEIMPRWIPVTERLPENAKKVLALVKRKLGGDGYYTMLLRYNHKKGAFFDYDSEWGDRRIHDVTHWMPLPKPPKGE